MRKMPKPPFNVMDVYADCISLVHNTSDKARLSSVTGSIQTSAIAYEVAASHNMLHSFPKLTNVGGIPKSEMQKVYTYRMVGKNQGGRKYYEAILSSAPNGKCPLCNHRIATTLDHHLAKTDYPDLVVTPINLIPACKDCNTIKDTFFPTSSEEETLHPYFDDIEDAQWLFARVEESHPATIEFYVNAPTDWGNVLSNRIINHFSLLEIEELYSSHAGEELLNIRYQLQQLYAAAGENSVRDHLYDSYISRSRNYKNSWQAALYQALSESDWFCSGGFDL